LTTGVTVCTFIAKGGSVEALRWARERGCPWTVTTCAWAAMGGHLAGPGACCPPRHPMQLDRRLLSQFKRSSMVKRVSCFTRPQHLEVLKWAREHGCPWDATTCKHAANGGHLEMLQWARERDCPWDAQTCSWAAIGGHLEVGPGRYCPTGARADAWCLLIRADASLSRVRYCQPRHPTRFESSSVETNGMASNIYEVLPGGPEVGAGGRLPVGLADQHHGCHVGQTGCPEVGVGA
jgi:hypothetical protein